jgi:hypothetical protein
MERIETKPIAKNNSNIIRSISRSTSKLVAAFVLEILIDLGNTNILTTSPSLKGRILFSAIEPKKGAIQFLNVAFLSIALSIIDHRNILKIYPKDREHIPTNKYFHSNLAKA